MLSAGLPLALQIVEWLFAAILFAAAVAGGYFLVKGRKIQTNNELADSAVASLMAANQALESRLDSVERENEHCIEMKRAQDEVIKSLNKRVDTLVEDVTQRAAVAEFRDEVRGLLLPMAAKLGVQPGEHPPVAVATR